MRRCRPRPVPPTALVVVLGIVVALILHFGWWIAGILGTLTLISALVR